MVRCYRTGEGARSNQNYDPVALAAGLKDAGGGMSIRKAAQKNGIPFSTLRRHLKIQDLRPYGGQTALTDKEEKLLVDALLTLAEWGFPLTATDLRVVVQHYLNKEDRREKRFRDNLPSEDWVRAFCRRHEELTNRFAENIKRCRAAVHRDIINAYFDSVEVSLKDVPASNIVNFDETNFKDDPGAKRVICRRGSKRVERVMDTSKTCTTVMFSVVANGNMLPPYIVYRAKNLYAPWTEGGPQGTVYSCSDSGWFDESTFEDYFKKILVPWARRTDGPKVIVGDNLSSHLSIPVIEDCLKLNIRFVLLPANSTHLTQPLDVAVFRPLKGEWRAVLEQWKLRNRGVLPKTEFPRKMAETLENMNTRMAANIQSGFKACGLYPVNRDSVLKRLPKENARPTSAAHSLNGVLIEKLEELRSDHQAPVPRGKKLAVTSGKSITAEDLKIMKEVQSEATTSKKKEPQPTSKRKGPQPKRPAKRHKINEDELSDPYEPEAVNEIPNEIEEEESSSEGIPKCS